MKSTFFLIFIFYFSFNSLCQENSDKFIVGGGIGFNYSKSKANKTFNDLNSKTTTYFSFSPLLGYNVYKDLFLGISISAYIINTNYDDFNDTYVHQYNFSFEPFLRYYFIKGFFGQLKFNIGRTYSEQKLNFYNPITSQNDLMQMNSKYTSFGINAALGYDIRIVENIYIEPMISYMSNTLLDKSNDNKEKQNIILFNIGITTKF